MLAALLISPTTTVPSFGTPPGGIAPQRAAVRAHSHAGSRAAHPAARRPVQIPVHYLWPTARRARTIRPARQRLWSRSGCCGRPGSRVRPLCCMPAAASTRSVHISQFGRSTDGRADKQATTPDGGSVRGYQEPYAPRLTAVPVTRPGGQSARLHVRHRRARAGHPLLPAFRTGK